jgi:acyl-CoA thioesterase FadM
VNKLLRTLLTLLAARRQPKLSMLDVSRLRLRVYPNDLDIANHVNNGVYLSLADFGRFNLLVRSGSWKILRARGWYPVVANLTISYRKSLGPWQRYTIETKLVGIHTSAYVIEQRFVVDGEIYARMFVRGKFLKRGGGVVTLEELAEAHQLDLSGLDAPEWVSSWSEFVALPRVKDPAPSTWD